MAYPFRDERPARTIAWGTWVLLVSCVAVFAFMQPKAMQGLTHGLSIDDNAHAELEIRGFEDRWALVPCEVTHNRSMADGAACGGYPSDHPEAYAPKNVWVPFLSALFVHANILHLLGNLLFLWVFGRGLEQRVGAVGVIGLFLAGGIAAFIGYVIAAPESTSPVLGASGAIAAVMGAYFVVQPQRRLLSFVYAAGVQVVYLPAWVFFAFFFASQFFTTPGTQVAWQAHVAGMVFGAAVGALWIWRDPLLRPSRAIERVEHHLVIEPPASAWPDRPPATPPVRPAASPLAQSADGKSLLGRQQVETHPHVDDRGPTC